MWDKSLFMTREQIRKYDKIAIETLGIPGTVLMENAGRGAARMVLARLGDKRRVGIVAGPGNNGGDGYVIARHLINSGIEATTYMAVPVDKVKGDAKVNFDILEKMGAAIVDITSPEALADLSLRLEGEELLVDALLGTGVSRTVEGRLGEVIDILNGVDRPIVAIDIPSGLDADTGVPWGRAVRALATCTFGHIKRGLLLFPGAELAGEIEVIPIGVPGSVSTKAGVDGAVLTEEAVCQKILKRRADAHKGSFGHLLIFGGLAGKTGAAAMVAGAAMRTGTGLVTLTTTADAQPILEAKCLEAMVEPIVETSSASLNDDVSMRIDVLLEGKKAVALGPGLGTEPMITKLALDFLEKTTVPCVVDADGINILAAQEEERIAQMDARLVLTPHPGEMARLVKKSVADVQKDRIGISREVAEKLGAVVVLKGANTIVADPGGSVYVNQTGNAGMASGGMGDVLTGIVGGLLAQGYSSLDAALIGVYLHGLAGDRVAEKLGMAGLIASDIIAEIPHILKGWE